MEFSSRCLTKCRDSSVSHSGDIIVTPIVKTLSADVGILSTIGEILSPIVKTLSADVGILVSLIEEILSLGTVLGDTSRRIPPRDSYCLASASNKRNGERQLGGPLLRVEHYKAYYIGIYRIYRTTTGAGLLGYKQACTEMNPLSGVARKNNQQL